MQPLRREQEKESEIRKAREKGVLNVYVTLAGHEQSLFKTPLLALDQATQWKKQHGLAELRKAVETKGEFQKHADQTAAQHRAFLVFEQITQHNQHASAVGMHRAD